MQANHMNEADPNQTISATGTGEPAQLPSASRGSTTKQSRRVLALSGGGFRATLFHLGVVRFLADAGLLTRVTDITSVSGGSILGAHLVLHWERYKTGGATFDSAAGELIDFIRRDIRNRILFWIVFFCGAPALACFSLLLLLGHRPVGYSVTASLAVGLLCIVIFDVLARLRTRLLVRHYGLLFRTKTDIIYKPSNATNYSRRAALLVSLLVSIACFWFLPSWLPACLIAAWIPIAIYILSLESGREAYEAFQLSHLSSSALSREPRPNLHLLATSLNHGLPCWFNHEGCHWLEPEPNDRSKTRYRYAETGQPEIAMAVAASSAFPPMFPPVPLTRAHLELPYAQLPQTLELTDGGVYDNAGLEILQCAVWKDCPIDHIVTSDAEGQFDSQPSRIRYLFTLPRNWRAIDILMKRINELAARDHTIAEQGAILKISIDALPVEKDQSGLDPRTQRSARAIRTDLDRFTDGEIHVLTSLGYSVARQASLKNHVAMDDSLHQLPAWSPIKAPEIKAQAKNGTLKFAGRLSRLAGLALPRRVFAWWAGPFLVFLLTIVAIIAATGLLPTRSGDNPQLPQDLSVETAELLNPIAHHNLLARAPFLEAVIGYLENEGTKSNQQYQMVLLRSSEILYPTTECIFAVRHEPRSFGITGFAFRVDATESRLFESIPISHATEGQLRLTIPPSRQGDRVIIIARIWLNGAAAFPPESKLVEQTKSSVEPPDTMK